MAIVKYAVGYEVERFWRITMLMRQTEKVSGFCTAWP